MQEPPMKLSRITVFFNPANLLIPGLSPVTLWCDDFYVNQSLDGNNLSVPQGITMIAFDLVQLPGGNPLIPAASFGTNGIDAEEMITWADPDAPGGWTATPPFSILVQRFFPSHGTAIVFNTVKNQNSHKFLVNVFYGGSVYPQDPTIVTEPPMPVG